MTRKPLPPPDPNRRMRGFEAASGFHRSAAGGEVVQRRTGRSRMEGLDGGSEGGTFYVSEKKLTAENANKVLLLLQKEAENAKKKELAGTITASWGDQIRSYVLQPYQMVKDLRTGVVSTSPDAVLDGAIDPFISAALAQRVTGETVEIEDVE